MISTAMPCWLSLCYVPRIRGILDPIGWIGREHVSILRVHAVATGTLGLQFWRV